jgi:hypothetical protein
MSLFSKQGIVLEKTIDREDLTSRIVSLKARLKSKTDILTRLRSFFDNADFAATLKIEQTMNQLVNEIEQVKGELRVLENRSRWAVVKISFDFVRRDEPVSLSSPFKWLNTVGLERFIEEF